jgi:hypothetical protein
MLYFSLFVVGVIVLSTTFILIFASFSANMGKYQGWSLSFVFIVLLCIELLAVFLNSGVEHAAARDKKAKVESQWQQAGCPVYKSQCGSKHPYACEQKAAIIGRNQVGDIFVQAYGICVK